MFEVKDEILNGEARYRIRDNDGNILFDNLILEQITPVQQEATPQNKVLYDNIAGNIDVVEKYNKVVTTRMEKTFSNAKDTFFDSSKNTFVANTTNYDYSYGEYRIVAKGLTSITSYSPLTNIIDGSSSTYAQIGWTESSGGYIEFIYPKAVNISKIYLYFNVPTGASYFENWQIQASNDDSTWTTLYTGSGTSYSANYLTFTNNNSYQYYRIVWNTDDDNYNKRVYLYRFEPYITGSLPEYNLFELSHKVEDYIDGLRIMLEPSNLVSAYPKYLTLNGMTEKLVSGDMENDKKYELVFDGSVFNAKLANFES